MHRIPADLERVFSADRAALKAWQKITPLSRNEWVCWCTMAKKTETRKERIRRMVADLKDGEKRPCCWPGCPHRRLQARKWF